MEVVADGLGGTILCATCSIPESYLITKLVGNESMNLYTKIETCANAWGNGVERIWQNGYSCQ